MGTTQAEDWAALPPAEQLNRFPNLSDRKLYLLVYQALGQDFEQYRFYPPDDPVIVAGRPVQPPSLWDQIGSLEVFADHAADRSSAESTEVWMRLKEAAVMAQEFELAAWCRDCLEGERLAEAGLRASARATRLRTLFNYQFIQTRDHRPGRGSLLLEILGPSREPVPFSADWRTATAVTLARQMYESRDFGAMPILADALQDAGCDSEAILSHCRDTSQTHVRGCWVTDLVLDKR